MSKRGTSASGYQASREKYKCPVKECQKSELRGDDIPLGQVSGITSILEVEQSIDSSMSTVYTPLAIQILILGYRDSLNNTTIENPSISKPCYSSTVVIFELKSQ